MTYYVALNANAASVLTAFYVKYISEKLLDEQSKNQEALALLFSCALLNFGLIKHTIISINSFQSSVKPS